MALPNCWEIKKCGREKDGNKVRELGECIASVEELGHTCWAIAGTLCGGVVQGTTAQKEKNCMACEVYKKYHRSMGSEGKKVVTEHPKEQDKYMKLLMKKNI